MLFIFSTPVLIRNLWQLKTFVFMLWYIIIAVLFLDLSNSVFCQQFCKLTCAGSDFVEFFV